MSVKTGAVGSNPKIDKLTKVSVNSLRNFAATSMLNAILSVPNDDSAVDMDGVEEDAHETAENSRTETERVRS